MELDCPNLSLATDWAAERDQDRVFLVCSIDGLRLCRDGEWAQASRSLVLWSFASRSHRFCWKLREFARATGIGGGCATRSGDADLIDLVRNAIGSGDVVGIHKSEAVQGAGETTVAQRRLARDIEARVRGHLSARGRQYKLVVGLDLQGVRDRSSYEVVPRDQAAALLDEMASLAIHQVRELLAKARAQLSRDWRPPLSPNGLVLLRRDYAPAAVASQEPALTPSQIWGKPGKEDDDIIDWTIWIELDPLDPKAQDDVVILLDAGYEEVMRKPLASCPREGTGVLVTFEKIGKHDRFTLIRDYGPNEGGGQDTLFIDSTPAEIDERGSKAS